MPNLNPNSIRKYVKSASGSVTSKAKQIVNGSKGGKVVEAVIDPTTTRQVKNIIVQATDAQVLTKANKFRKILLGTAGVGAAGITTLGGYMAFKNLISSPNSASDDKIDSVIDRIREDQIRGNDKDGQDRDISSSVSKQLRDLDGLIRIYELNRVSQRRPFTVADKLAKLAIAYSKGDDEILKQVMRALNMILAGYFLGISYESLDSTFADEKFNDWYDSTGETEVFIESLMTHATDLMSCQNTKAL